MTVPCYPARSPQALSNAFMKPFRSPLALAALALLTVLGVAAGALVAPSHLRATGATTPVPHYDDDGDGLDNALEQRLGLPIDDADADDDSINDLAELLAGTDPRVPQQPSEVPPSQPAVVMEAYANSRQFVIQIFVQHRTSLDMLRFHLATETKYLTIKGSTFQRYLNRQSVQPGYEPGFSVTSLRYALPLRYFTQAGTFAFAAQAMVDGNRLVADEFRFQDENPQQTLQEWRQQSGQSGEPGGGLFPANPNLPPPGESQVNQVCIQELQATGTFGAGGVVYAVSNAYCDTLLQATCVSACPSTVGGTVIGIDIASLIN